MVFSRQFCERALLLCISTALMYYVTMLLMEKTNVMGLDLENNEKEISKLQKHIDKKLSLNMYEKSLLSSVVYPSDINCSLDKIGGHNDIKNRLDKVLFKPLENNTYLHGPLFSPPNGIILHGQPGTGKTMFAKAIAKRLDGVFISCGPSCFENKLYGESSKIIKALFSLANKIHPCVIFIDEIDGILGSRNDFDQSFVNEVKTIFLAEMDGIIERHPNIVFIGATNKLNSIDKAVQRRMRLHIDVPLPDTDSRESILKIHLDKYKCDFSQVLKDTNGFSGSDLFELCKLAGLEAISNNRSNISSDDLKCALNLLK